MFCPKVVALAWAGDNLSRGQPWGLTHSLTHRQTRATKISESQNLPGVETRPLQRGDWSAIRRVPTEFRHDRRNLFDIACIIRNHTKRTSRGISLVRNVTHRSRDKMAVIFQTTFSNAFSWIQMYKFGLIFHGSLFPRVQFTILKQLWDWLGAGKAASHYLSQLC